MSQIAGLTPVILAGWLLLALTGCAGGGVVTEEEMRLQDRADAAVSRILFEHELDELASYHVRKNGFVVIKFHMSVPRPAYTGIVEALRANADIGGVRAEQGGVEVCPLSP